MSNRIPFSVPFRAANELSNLEEALASGHVHGDGQFTAKATKLLSETLEGARVLLTTSGTHALEMASMLVGVKPGDEVIMPSFTFSSAATAVTQFGATPVFIDCDPSTGNIRPDLIPAAITDRTRAISIVHYGGVGADMAAISAIANGHGLSVIEDNAHGLFGTLDDRPLGTFGDVAIQSFHDTKNIHSGEGGALVVNDPALAERAEIIREKGTNRSRFLRGQVDKYTWVDVGSSYLMSELSAAVLTAQLGQAEETQRERLGIWNTYARDLGEWAYRVGAELMHEPKGRAHPAHLFFIKMPSAELQTRLIAHLRRYDVIATFHYVPLHSSPAGLRLGRVAGPMEATNAFSSRIVRLPLWAALGREGTERVVEAVTLFEPNASPS